MANFFLREWSIPSCTTRVGKTKRHRTVSIVSRKKTCWPSLVSMGEVYKSVLGNSRRSWRTAELLGIYGRELVSVPTRILSARVFWCWWCSHKSRLRISVVLLLPVSGDSIVFFLNALELLYSLVGDFYSKDKCFSDLLDDLCWLRLSQTSDIGRGEGRETRAVCP